MAQKRKRLDEKARIWSLHHLHSSFCSSFPCVLRRKQQVASDASEETAAEDAQSRSFIDTGFLQTFDLSKNVLLYFSLSPFFDKQSINHIIAIRGGLPEQMTGIEFAVDDSPELVKYQPTLFVIKKQERFSPTHVRVLQYYYVLEGVVYQAPPFHNLLTSRVHKIEGYLRSAFKQMIEHRRYTSQGGATSWVWSSDSKMSLRPQELIIAGDQNIEASVETDMEEFVRKLEEEQQQQQQLRPTGLSEEAEMKQQEA